MAFTVNGLNQYTNVDGSAFAYDSNGNLTSDGVTTYLYDIENRLIKATASGKDVRLEYDPMGRLYQVHDVIANSKTRFLWDGDELVAEFDDTGTALRRHLHGPGIDDPVSSHAGASFAYASMSYTIADRQGSIVALADQNGNVTDRNAYDNYGVPLSPTSASPMVGRFGYTGQAWIPELGLWHYKARFYSPTLGRFMQTDPIGYEDQINLYAYVGNDPVNMFDPTGMVSAMTYAEFKGFQGVNYVEPRADSPADDHTFRDRAAAAGAAAGAIVGGVAGGTAGGAAGATAGLACGPGAVACSPTAGTAGAVAGAAAGAAGGAVAGGVAGAIIGDIIDKGIALFNSSSRGDGGSSGDRQFNGRPGSNTAQNRQVTDAARQEGLNSTQRRELGRAVEAESRQGGANLGYQDIREIARAIKSGSY